MSSSLEEFLNDLYANKQPVANKQSDDESFAELSAPLATPLATSLEAPLVAQQVPPVLPIKKSQQSKSEIFYHIIFDCDIDKLRTNDDNVFKGEYTGNIRDFADETNRVPVLFNYKDVQAVASKLVGWTMKKGTAKNKKIPVFGAIALGYRTDSLKIATSAVDPAQHGGKNYTEIFKQLKELEQKDNNDLVTYNAQMKRGLIKKGALSGLKPISICYCHKLSTPLNIGLSLLNLLPNLNEDDIKLLRQVYDVADGEHHMLQGEQKVVNDKIENIVDSVDSVDTETSAIRELVLDIKSDELTGGYYEKLANLEKRKYLELKKIAEEKGLLIKKRR